MSETATAENVADLARAQAKAPVPPVFLVVVDGKPEGLTPLATANALLADPDARTAILEVVRADLLAWGVVMGGPTKAAPTAELATAGATATMTAPSDLPPDTHVTGTEILPISVGVGGEYFNERLTLNTLAAWLLGLVAQAHTKAAQQLASTKAGN